MSIKTIQVLMVEDNMGDVRLLQEALIQARATHLHLVNAQSMAEAVKFVEHKKFDVILLDLHLPDMNGFETFTHMRMVAHNVPIVVLTGLHDDEVAIKAIQQGAQDYLVKQHVNANVVLRVISYAMERHRLLEELRSLSLVDDMTGLYNRRGFMHLANQQLKIAHRMKRKMSLIYCDMDNLKSINDTHGHHQGNKAIVELVGIFKNTVRESDIVARLGGDEFVIFLVESDKPFLDSILARIQKNIDAHNDKSGRGYHLSISMGVSNYSPSSPVQLNDLLISADKLMYEQKTRKKQQTSKK